jgi:hypothetical protein
LDDDFVVGQLFTSDSVLLAICQSTSRVTERVPGEYTVHQPVPQSARPPYTPVSHTEDLLVGKVFIPSSPEIPPTANFVQTVVVATDEIMTSALKGSKKSATRKRSSKKAKLVTPLEPDVPDSAAVTQSTPNNVIEAPAVVNISKEKVVPSKSATKSTKQLAKATATQPASAESNILEPFPAAPSITVVAALEQGVEPTKIAEINVSKKNKSVTKEVPTSNSDVGDQSVSEKITNTAVDNAPRPEVIAARPYKQKSPKKSPAESTEMIVESVPKLTTVDMEVEATFSEISTSPCSSVEPLEAVREPIKVVSRSPEKITEFKVADEIHSPRPVHVSPTLLRPTTAAELSAVIQADPSQSDSDSDLNEDLMAIPVVRSESITSLMKAQTMYQKTPGSSSLSEDDGEQLIFSQHRPSLTSLTQELRCNSISPPSGDQKTDVRPVIAARAARGRGHKRKPRNNANSRQEIPSDK